MTPIKCPCAIEEDIIMPRNNIDLKPCPYNHEVQCDMAARCTDCHSCGWYPAEEYRRKEYLRKVIADGKN